MKWSRKSVKKKKKKKSKNNNIILVIKIWGEKRISSIFIQSLDLIVRYPVSIKVITLLLTCLTKLYNVVVIFHSIDTDSNTIDMIVIKMAKRY